MQAFNRFTRGAGCYQCRICGKMTRETGDGESHVQLCALCYERAGLENSHLDGHHKSGAEDGCPYCEKPEEVARTFGQDFAARVNPPHEDEPTCECEHESHADHHGCSGVDCEVRNTDFGKFLVCPACLAAGHMPKKGAMLTEARATASAEFATFDAHAGLLQAESGAPWFFEFKRGEPWAVDDGLELHIGVGLVLDTLEEQMHSATEPEEVTL